MIEKYVPLGAMRPIKYVLGAILEVIGFGLLFAFDKTMNYIHQYPIVFAIILVIGGYFCAISGRRR